MYVDNFACPEAEDREARLKKNEFPSFCLKDGLSYISPLLCIFTRGIFRTVSVDVNGEESRITMIEVNNDYYNHYHHND